MSGARQCEGHAQFHRREPLKASPQSDSLRLHLLRVLGFFFFLPLFSPGASAINFKLFSFAVFTLRCFHYANTKLVAGLMFLFTFFFFFSDGKWD